MPRNIMRALCATIPPDHFKFASYGPGVYVVGGCNVVAIEQGFYEPYQALPSASMSNRTVNFAGEHR